MTRVLVPACLAGVLLVLCPAPASAATDDDPVRVLRQWDRQRERALLTGEPRRLRRLYVPGAAAGEADVRMLRGYADRGWRLTAVDSQVFSVATLERSPERLVLQVVDRFAGGSVVGHRRCRALPHGRPVARVVELRRTPSGWLVAAVTLTPAG